MHISKITLYVMTFFQKNIHTTTHSKRMLMGIFFALTMLSPSTALASDISAIVSGLPASTLSGLPTFFLSSPTTANFALLSSASRSLILNTLAPGDGARLPIDMFSSFSNTGLVATLDGLSGASLSSLTTGLTGLTSGALNAVLANLTLGLLSSLPGTLLTGSSLPIATITSILNGLSSADLSQLTAGLFINYSPADLTSIVGSLNATALSSLTYGLENLTPAQYTSILTGISPTLIPSFPIAMFAGISSANLNTVLGSLTPSILKALTIDIFKFVDPTVLSAIPASILSQLDPAVLQGIIEAANTPPGIVPTANTCKSLGSAKAVTSSAGGVYVPVIDIQLNPSFNKYATAFNKYASSFDQYVCQLFNRWDYTFGGPPDGTTDALRDLISGKDPGGLAKEKCAVGDTEYAAYAEGTVQATPAPDWGPWMFAFGSSSAAGGDLPNEVPTGARTGGKHVQVNTSNSLRCLLKEVVGWQKLGMSIQLHQMLKQYISDAQTTQLNKQLMNRVTAANLNFAKAGNIVNNGGSVTTQAVYNVNIAQNEYNVNERQLEEATDEAANDPLSGSPQGSWGLCQPWRLDTAATMVRNNRTTTEDPFNYPQEQTECRLNATDNIDPANWDNYSDNFNDPSGNGVATFLDGLSNPQDTPLGASSVATAEVKKRIENQQRITDKKAANPGYVPTTQYDTANPADPHSLDMQYGEDVTPSSENANNLNSLVEGQNNQIANSTSLDTQAGPESENAATDINTSTGLAGANTLPLQTSQTAINSLVQEFYDVIQYGYYGLDDGKAGSNNTPNVTDWAEGTMLSIYDQMHFSQTNPETIVPTSKTTEVDTGY